VAEREWQNHPDSARARLAFCGHDIIRQRNARAGPSEKADTTAIADAKRRNGKMVQRFLQKTGRCPIEANLGT
jgi:hypothetical protein